MSVAATPELSGVFSDQNLSQSLGRAVNDLQEGSLNKGSVLLKTDSAPISKEIKQLCRMAKQDIKPIQKLIHDVYLILQDPVENNDYIVLLKKSSFVEQGISLILEYLDSYEPVLHPKLIEELNSTLDNFSINYLSTKGFGLLGESQNYKDLVIQFKKYSEGMDCLSDYARTILAIDPQDFLNSHEKKLFSDICENNLNYSFPSNDELKKAGFSNERSCLILNLIKKIKLDSFTIVKAIEERVSLSVVSDMDGRIVYLSPSSAEGKAIKRLEGIESGREVKWNLHVKAGDVENEEDLDEWLIANGYL